MGSGNYLFHGLADRGSVKLLLSFRESSLSLLEKKGFPFQALRSKVRLCANKEEKRSVLV